MAKWKVSGTGYLCEGSIAMASDVEGDTPALEEIARKLNAFEAMQRDLGFLRDWMKRCLGNLEQRSPKGHTYSVTGTDSWAVAAIPDWDLRQRLEQVEKMIVSPEEVANA